MDIYLLFLFALWPVGSCTAVVVFPFLFYIENSTPAQARYDKLDFRMVKIWFSRTNSIFIIDKNKSHNFVPLHPWQYYIPQLQVTKPPPMCVYHSIPHDIHIVQNTFQPAAMATFCLPAVWYKFKCTTTLVVTIQLSYHFPTVVKQWELWLIIWWL